MFRAEKFVMEPEFQNFWEQLNLAVGTEEDVKIRREVNELYVYALGESQRYREYLGGSQGEGFRFPWSDIDIMRSLIRYYVYIDSLHNECAFVAKSNGCQPGFCRLIFIDDGNVKSAQKHCFSRHFYLQKVKQISFNGNFDRTIRGPCFSTKYPTGLDSCDAFQVHPDSSNKFLKTFEKNFWNSIKSQVIHENITVMHCVPKGPEKGDEEGMQWLVSFSVLEQKIVCSLNHVQFCCYGLMKILVHTMIDSCAETNDTLSSYHLKTVLFYVLEDIHHDFWIPQNIFTCLRICLTRLLLFVTKGCCPNYFLHESNLFLKTKFIENRFRLQEELLQLINCENNSICFIVCLSIPFAVLEVQYESCALRTFYSLCSALDLVKGYQTTYRGCITSILKIMHVLQIEEDQMRVAILKYIWLLIMQRIGVIMYDKFVLTGFDRYLLSAEVALMFAQHSDVFGLVYLATLWYCQGKYKRCIKLFSDRTYCSINPASKIVHTESLATKCTKRPRHYSMLLQQHNIKQYVNLHRTSHLYPKDLENLVKKCPIFEFIVFGKSYAYFLLFLCHYNLHNEACCIRVFSMLLQSYRELLFPVTDLVVKNTEKLIVIAKIKKQTVSRIQTAI